MEIAIMTRLHHPNIVQLYDVYDNGETISLIME